MLHRYAVALVLLAAPLVAAGQAAQDLTLTAPDGNAVVIDRDDYGVPHVAAPTEAAVFFGQGFAIAQDRLFQMETFWRTATGRLAELQGPAALEQDQQIRTVYYTPAERADQFARLEPAVQDMMDTYIAGINAYIDSTGANPQRYLPGQYAAGGFAPEDWDRDKLVAVLQFFMRQFGEVGGQELERLAELEAQGHDWFEANRPVNDPTAPTTIQVGTPPPSGDPTGTRRAGRTYPEGVGAFATAGAAHLVRQRAASDALLSGLGVPLKFGSFAAVIADEISASGSVMLLGAPQMGAPTATAPAVVSEVELMVDGGIHVAGMTVPGIPGVIIGRTADRTWTLTTGYTDNTDTYIEVLGPPAQGGVPTYMYNGTVTPAQVIPETFRVRGQADETFVHFRTVHGPVYFQDPNGQFVASWKYAFWGRELEMVEAFYDIWRAQSLGAFEAAAARVTMSFNLFYADREQNIAFWHVGTYPVRAGTVDPRLPAMGTGEEEWVGEVPFAAQPQEVNPDKGYFVNWNNKPAPWWNQGDNVGWAEGRGRSYNGVTALEDHLRSVAPVSFDELQELARVVRTNTISQEYPGTYQQVVELTPDGGGRAENVIPPGQSGFINAAGVPSPNVADQWAFYQSSTGTGDVQMKTFVFTGLVAVGAEDGVDAGAIGLGLPAPNPTAGRVRVRYRLDAPAVVRLSVVDALGREVAVLAEGDRAAGEHPAGLDTRALALGLYVVRLAVNGRVSHRRFVAAR